MSHIYDYDSYRAYLTHDPHWRQLKGQVHARAHGRCEYTTANERRCRRPGRDTHHLTYARLGHERLDDLILLCQTHHQQAHVIRRPWAGEWFRIVPEAKPMTYYMLRSARWYVIMPELTNRLGWHERYTLYLAQPQAKGPCFLWPIRDVSFPEWWVSYRWLAKLASSQWVMMQERHDRAWKRPFAEGEPKRPRESYKHIFWRALGDEGLIDSIEHPQARQLRGAD